MSRKLLAAGLVCGALFVSTAQAGTASADVALKPVAAPLFNVASDAGRIGLADFKGKVVLLDFWASWCGPCRHSFKWLNELHTRHGDDGLVILGVNLDEERSDALRFLKEYPAAFQIGYDSEGKVAQSYRVKGMPSSYLIDRQGRIRVAHVGFRERDKQPLEAEIRSLLSETDVASK